MKDLVEELEEKLGFRLPEDYREFLINHRNSFLDAALVFKPPRSGAVDELLTVAEILENDAKERIGFPELHLLHIGGDLMDGYLYLKVSEDGFGEVHYMNNYVFREQFSSFSEFLEQTRKNLAMKTKLESSLAASKAHSAKSTPANRAGRGGLPFIFTLAAPRSGAEFGRSATGYVRPDNE